MSFRPYCLLTSIRLAFLGFAVASFTGCASLGSPSTWFNKSTGPEASSLAKDSSLTSSLASAGTGLSSQIKSMGTTVSSAVGKAKDAVVSTFTTKPAMGVDPETSLANMPKALTGELWVTQGHAAELKGNYASAMDFYTKALEQEPNSVPALLSTARLHVRQEQYSTAVEFYQRVINLGPSADLYAELADVQHKAGKIAEAQASIGQAIAMQPDVARYRNNLAGMLVSVGRSDEAVRQLETIFPPAVANYNVAYLHFMNKNMPAAQQHLQVALAADPNLKPARDLLSTLTQSQPGQLAMTAYNMASQVTGTAQGSVAPNVQATQVPYPSQTTPESGYQPTQGNQPPVYQPNMMQPSTQQPEYPSWPQ